MPVPVCHGSCGKETLILSCSAPLITPNPTPGFDGRAIIPAAVHWIVECPRLLQPWGKGKHPRIEEAVHNPDVPLLPGCSSCTR